MEKSKAWNWYLDSDKIECVMNEVAKIAKYFRYYIESDIYKITYDRYNRT